MARSSYKFLSGDSCSYSITCTTINWLPLFSNPDIVCILVDSLRFLIDRRRIKLKAYVIMENHIHLVASAEDLSTQIANFKSFTARKSIDYYLEQDNRFTLDQLAFHKRKHKTDRRYQLWQEGSHPRRIVDQAMMEQKITYIHQNPVRRGYVDLPEHWRYSSARNYAGMKGVNEVSMDW